MTSTLTAFFLPKSDKDGVPFLMHDDLFGQDGLGTSLVLHQVVFAHKHPVGELSAAGENRLLRPEDFVCLVEQI